MRALLFLALVINVTWAVDIVCLSNIDSINPIEKICPSGTRYCYRETDTDGLEKWGCGLCPNGAGPGCEQCVGNTDTPCNTESYAHGSKCDVTHDNTVIPVFCAEGIAVCYSWTKNDATTYGCGFCPDPVTVNDGCNQCLGNMNTPCNTDAYKLGARCELPTQTKDGLVAVDCPTDTVLCYSPLSAYTGKGDYPKDVSKYGCGFCPETENDCIQCQGTGCNRAYEKKVKPDAEIYCHVTTKTYSKGSLIPITVSARCGTPENEKYCYGQPVMNTPIYMEYGCGDCSRKEYDCEVCVGSNKGPCTPLFNDDEKKDYNHGTVMMLNTLLLPLLLALWV